MSDRRDLPPGEDDQDQGFDEDQAVEVGEAYDDWARRMRLQRYIDTARRGVGSQVQPGVAMAQQLLEATFRSPVSIAIVCLPDSLNTPPQAIRYVISYGSGGVMRTSAPLLPGVWYCGGDRIRVSVSTAGTNMLSFAQAFWYLCHTAHNIP